jgi:hypothetical protein
MALVYQHRRKDNNSIFYIGIGCNVKRAYSKRNRNKHWINIANNIGYEVDILIDNISFEMACAIEYILIILYGRVDLKTGLLVNLTDGGKGSINFKHKPETILKISGTNSHKYKMGHLQAGDKNPMYGRRGIFSPTFGKTGYKNHSSKEVGQFDLKSGKLINKYGSTREAYRLTNIHYSSISMCCKKHVNYTHAGGYKWEYLN